MYSGVPQTMPAMVMAEPSPVALRGDLGDAEVADLDEVALAAHVEQHDVLGLEIAVDDALVVRLVERAEDLPADVSDALEREGEVLLDARDTGRAPTAAPWR